MSAGLLFFYHIPRECVRHKVLTWSVPVVMMHIPAYKFARYRRKEKVAV